MAGDKRWPQSAWDNDGGGGSWRSEESHELINGDSVPDVHTGKGDENVGDPAVDKVTNEVGVLSLFDKHLSFINF